MPFVVIAIGILFLEQKQQFVEDDEFSLSLRPSHMDLTLTLGAGRGGGIMKSQKYGYNEVEKGLHVIQQDL